MKYNFWVLFFLISASQLGIAQTDHFFLRKGDKEYKREDYVTSEEYYRKALEKKDLPSANTKYNLGNSIYQQKRYDDAIREYEKTLSATNSDDLKARTFYNLGNAYFQKKDYPKSIDAYKNALRINPNDELAKYNLAQALRMQKQEEQKQNSSQQQQQEQSEEEQEENEQQNQQEQNQKEGESQQQQTQNNKTPENSQEQQLTREEAEQLLKIMEQEEKQVQEKLRKGNTKPPKSLKDW